MGKIFCLMGKSASGKDTVYAHLLSDSEIRLCRVISYTTRPIRSGEKDGETYFFCTEEMAGHMQNEGRIIELREYQTVYGPWKYFTADDGQIQLDKNNYLIIGTLDSYQKLRSYFGEEKVLPIYIRVDDGIRLARALERETIQAEPRYAELCRRFLADEEDFSEENIRKAGIQRIFENTDIDSVQREIISYIKENT